MYPDDSIAAPPPRYTFDAGRLAALDDYAILDSPSEPGFDDIVQLAAQICEAPVALVSLVAADRQWFKARVGFEPCETDLDSSVCAHALIVPDLLIIPDLTHDERTMANPLVTGDPQIRFYAGAPFRAASGEVLGSLCVIDSKPRPDGLTAAQASGLRNLARQVTSQMNLRRAIVERDVFLAEQRQAERRRNGLMQLGDLLREADSLAEMTRVAATIVGETLRVSRAAFGRFDESSEYLVVEPGWTAAGLTSIAGRHRLDEYGTLLEGLLRGEHLIVDDVATDPRTAANAEAVQAIDVGSFVNLPVRRDGRTTAVLIVHDRQPQVWAPEVLTFLRNVADRFEVGMARLDAVAEQQVLNHELSHRMNNTFAMIQAIATQTLQRIPDQEPVRSFIKRLHALSGAHDMLLHRNWSSAEISEVVRAVVFRLAETARFDLSGPEVQLGPRATLSFSLLLHELTANAVKYGSLSSESGRVAVTWGLNDVDGGETEMTLHWQETGGPPAAQPTRKGFGSKLIRMGLVGTGGVELRYLPAGLQAEFNAPLAQVQLA